MAASLLRVLDRYLLREILPPFGLGVLLFTFFLVIDRIYHLADLVVTKGVPFHVVLQLLVYILPSFLAWTLPMALLVSVLIAGGRLAGDLEIVACKAAGVSVYRLARPVLLAGVVVALMVATLTLVVNPIANREFQRQLLAVLQSRAASAVQERVFVSAFGQVTIYVEDISPSQVRLRGLLVSDERDPKLSRIITAREGRLLTDEPSGRVILRLLDGAVNEADVTPADPPPTPGTPSTPGGAASAGRYRHGRFAIYDLALSLDSPLAGSQKGDKPEKDLRTSELRARLRELAGDQRARAPFLVEWHKRLALPAAAIVFALVAFPLAVRSHRGGRSIALVGSLAILVSYYLVFTTLEGAALRRRLPIGLAIWLPNALYAALGIGLLVMAARERGWRRLEALRDRAVALWARVPRPVLRHERPVHAEARDSTHIIDRYVVREFAAFLTLSLLVVAALVMVVDLFQTLDRFLRLKPPLLHIAQHFAYRLPVDVYRALPIVMLVATVLLFLTLSRSHELTALKAAGVSIYRVSAPVLACGLAIAVAAALFQELLLPRLNERREEVDRVKIKGQLPRHLQTRTRLWVRSADTRFYRVELLAPASGDLFGMTVLEVDGDFRLVQRLDARQARWTGSGWELRDGAYREIAPSGEVRTIPFTRTALVLPETLEDFTQIQKPVTAMSYVELAEYIARLEAAGFQVRKYLVDLYAKLANPLENLIMVLIAIPFALQVPRGGRLTGVALAIGIMVAYLLVDRIAIAFARADLLPPILGAWSANVIFVGIGASLFARART